MEVYTDIEEFSGVDKPVVTSGTFDGVHVGHQKILDKLKEEAQKINGETVILTFFPHPRMVLNPDDHGLKLINTIDEKIDLLRDYNIDHLIVHPFTEEFSRLSSFEFVRDYLVNKIHTKKLVIGYDHHFGRNREGSFEHLKEFGPVYGFEVEEIPAQDVDSVSVSSTKIRKALEKGDISIANKYLGHEYSLQGKVVEGEKVGTEIGFPTANIQIKEKYKLIPSKGVYAVKVKHEGNTYKGMLNIGNRPTLKSDDSDITVEVNIFDLKKDLYTEHLKVIFVERIRDEKKFDSLEELQSQLKIDKEKVNQKLREL